MVEQLTQEGWTQLGGSCTEATTKSPLLPHDLLFISSQVVSGNLGYPQLASCSIEVLWSSISHLAVALACLHMGA